MVFEHVYDYIFDTAPVLFFKLGADGSVLSMNHYARQVCGELSPGMKFQDLILDFNSIFDLKNLSDTQLGEQMFHINTLSGYPQSYLFLFKPVGKEFLAFGHLDIKDIDMMRVEFLLLNQELGNLSRQLNKKNAELQSDITERKRAEEELAIYRNLLEDLVEQRTADLQKEIDLRRRTEKELQKSEERFKAIADYSSDWETWMNPEGRVEWTNLAMERMTGYTREEYTGLSLDERTKKIVCPEDQQNIHEILQKSLSKKTSDNDILFRILRKDGEMRWVSMSFQPIYGMNGEYLGLRTSTRDITDRKNLEAEKKQLEDRLMRSQKLEALGTLSSGIAHDFNNILTGMIAYTQLLLMRQFPDDDYVKESLNQILQAAYQARDLTRQIVAFSRKIEPEKELVLLENITRDTVKMMRASIPSTIQIKEEIKNSSCTVFADLSQIHQVFMNLCTNATQAMKDKGGILKITLDKMTLNETQCRLIGEIPPGKYVEITVSDTGQGIAPEHILKIFDPYFTTKKVGEGTGLGLSVSYGIIKNHNGTITVQSQPGQGTVFRVFIPYYLHEITQPVEIKPNPIPFKKAAILFVDDEVIIAMGVRMVLKNLGHEIIFKTSAKEALEAFKVSPDRFDIVITDLTMPEMTGDVLAREIKKIRPDIPIVLCTGFQEENNEITTAKYGVDAFVQKPYDKEKLAEIIHKMIS